MSRKVSVKAVGWWYAIAQKARDYQQLVKLRLSLVVVFSSWMAFLIASGSQIEWLLSLVLALGGFGVTAAANALNQVFEKDYDRQMKRTADRPLAADRMGSGEAVLAAGIFGTVGLLLLAFIHPIVAFFGALSLIIYAFLYTPLKRKGTAAVAVGAVSGALPVFIGAVAAQGEITALAFILFAFQFFWQFPHFLAIGFLAFADYQKAGYRLLPADSQGGPSKALGSHSIWYALLLVSISGIPFGLGITSWLSFVLLLVLSLLYAGMGYRFYRMFDRRSALGLMFFSFLYNPLVLIVLFADKI